MTVMSRNAPEIVPEDISSDLVSGEVHQTDSLERMKLVWEGRRFIFRASVIGFLVGVVIAFAIPKQYESSVQLMPPDNQSSSGLLMAVLAARNGSMGSVAGDLLGLKSSGDLFVGVLHSRTVQEKLVQQFDLRKIYDLNLMEDARKKLSSKTNISSDRKSGIITILVTDRDPRRAQTLADAYINELNYVVSKLSTSSASRERSFLEERLKVVKQDLDQASRDFSQFASKNTAIDIKEQGKAMLAGAAALEGQLIASESEMKGLETIYTSNNARVKALQARINELRKQLNDMGGKSVESADDVGPGDSLYPSIRQLPILGVTYADLYRRTKIEEAIYETLTQQYELAKVQEAKEIPSVKVLDAANIPEKMSYPPRTLIIFLVGCFSAAAASVVVIGKGNWAQIHPSNPKKVFVQEVFHTIAERMPWSPPNGSRWHAATHKAWRTVVRRQTTNN